MKTVFNWLDHERLKGFKHENQSQWDSKKEQLFNNFECLEIANDEIKKFLINWLEEICKGRDWYSSRAFLNGYSLALLSTQAIDVDTYQELLIVLAAANDYWQGYVRDSEALHVLIYGSL